MDYTALDTAMKDNQIETISTGSTAEPKASPSVGLAGPTVIALGGNAIGDNESPGAPADLKTASKAIADAAKSGLVITHGNGPQVGFLQQIQQADKQQSLDILGAETEGWLGYQIEQAIAGYLPKEQESISVMTRMEVNNDDPALDRPTKPIGGWLDADEAERLESEHNWQFIQDGHKFRRVVPSPAPVACLQINSIKALLNAGSIVICAGGGGIPVARTGPGGFAGLDAVIDKDLASALIARQLGAELLVLATNVDGVYQHWSQEAQEAQEAQEGAPLSRQPASRSEPLARATPEQLDDLDLDAGSMGPKVEAACAFTRHTGKPAVIGHLNELEQLLQQAAGTLIQNA